MNYGDNRLKRITRFLYKWLWCSWLHNGKEVGNPKQRCYPRDPEGYWHCEKCHPCGEGFDFLTGEKNRGWL